MGKELDNTEEITKKIKEVLIEKSPLHRRLANAYPKFVAVKLKLKEKTEEIKQQVKEQKIEIKNQVEKQKNEILEQIQQQKMEVGKLIDKTSKEVKVKILNKNNKSKK